MNNNEEKVMEVELMELLIQSATPNTNICSKCGNELQAGQEYCSKCGQKVEQGTDSSTTVEIISSDTTNEQPKKKISPKIVTKIVVALVVVVLVAFGISKLFVSVEDLCAKGEYTEAYEKAKDTNEKLKVKVESIAAITSAYSADMLKDPSSFQLRDVYYNSKGNEDSIAEKDSIVLIITANNSYGAKVSNYWYYAWNDDEQEWEYKCAVSDLSEEKTYSSDSYSEQMESIHNNIYRIYIQNIIRTGIELDKTAVEHINNLFKKGTLNKVKAINRTD